MYSKTEYNYQFLLVLNLIVDPALANFLVFSVIGASPYSWDRDKEMFLLAFNILFTLFYLDASLIYPFVAYNKAWALDYSSNALILI